MKSAVKHRKSLFSKKTKGEIVVYSIVEVLFVLYALSLIVPFLWMFVSSFKYFVDFQLDMAGGKPFSFPSKWQWSNYIDAFKMMQYEGTTFIGMFWNSIWQAAVSIAVSTIVSAAFAYTVSKFRFPGCSFLFGLIITISVLPVATGSGAVYKLYVDLGLYDNPLLFVVSSLGWGNFLFLYGFFKGISNSYSEAVYIDGGGEFTAFFRAVLPQAVPLLTALAVMSFIAKWNDYLSILLYMPSYPTIASGLYLVQNTLLRTGKNPIYYAGMMIATVPIVAMYMACSNTIMENMSLGGLKG